ncbi:hypothetical protein BDE36_3732 [Arcticibacter tournemirensis]|uniref:Glycogen debranching enzyme C-terminal domain-containing protein n=1 Tax=Arcticibacter tournemirensis TaxID=699437 RepID=A0A5M9H897_9SPHI|nr:hypothetical protein [Arcticibacter tournemirensis]KAA8483146.1 hypothetical protein F1649_10065 [Arcticibacter tournemirensis]TQM51938.1 hypothetical protein BDE36_3732 [Arcticibacter tournemirensis]
MIRNTFESIIIISVIFCFSLKGLFAQSHTVDYRYAPQWHVSCISFPDDTCKTLVGPLGQVFYDFGSRSFFPFANDRGFATVVHFLADEGIKISDQKLLNARVPIVQTMSSVGGMSVTQETFALGLDYMRKGISTKAGNREDLILTEVRNNSGKDQTIRPVLIVNSDHKVSAQDRIVTITDSLGKTAHVYLSEKVKILRQNLAGADYKTVIELEPVKVVNGSIVKIAALYDNAKASLLSKEMESDPPRFLKKTGDLRKEVIDYWTNRTNIPYGHIEIPDEEIQNLIDASLRGIWQAREIKKNSIAFQVGPTCYRGLWIVDGAFLLETAALMGRGEDARDGINYLLSFQDTTGGFGKMSSNYWKENGIVLWTCVRHAMLSQDKQWLRSVWPKLRRTVGFIRKLRGQTLDNSISLDDGLIPPGEIDGGLWGKKDMAEYTNIYWCLAGLKTMIQAAEWLGMKQDGKDWTREYHDFYSKFRKAALRDLASDSFGNKYLPVVMDPKQRSLPQRAQWAFCQAVYPGQLFEKDDKIASGTMNMLESTLQEGMVMGTGWIIEGIWNYFASFYGHACLWRGDGGKAIGALYAFANHASPLYAWREEHNPRDLQAKYVGDMPHNWASAEFIRLAVHLLALDRGDEIHLLEGLPKEWIRPGMKTSLKEIATPFGLLSFTIQVDAEGKSAVLNVSKLSDKACRAMYVHLGKWGKKGQNSLVRLSPDKDNHLIIDLQ